jgi:SAM-dependent methyltransferase
MISTMREQKTNEVQAAYDRLAAEYSSHLYDELQHKPLDRRLLDRFAQQVKDIGPVCDLGCGPGQVARYLQERGVSVSGLDLSSGMIQEARRLNPSIDFFEGDMFALPVENEAWAGIAASYAIVNFPPADLPVVLREMHRALRPGGCLLMSFHIGEEIVHVDHLWGCPADLDFYFFSTGQVTRDLLASGFEIDDVIERDPYAPEIEYQSRRAYIFASRPVKITKP